MAELTRRMQTAGLGVEVDFGERGKLLMYRSQVNQPGPDGWQTARSTQGEFSVEIPLPYNDFRERGPGRDGVEVESHVIGGKTPGKLSWAATCVIRVDHTLQPGAEKPGTDRSELVGDPVKAETRVLQFKDRTCLLVVEAQGADPLAPKEARRRFLRSFKAEWQQTR